MVRLVSRTCYKRRVKMKMWAEGASDGTNSEREPTEDSEEEGGW